MEAITSGSKLVQATKHYIEHRYLHETPPHLVYHDFAHIMEVTEAAAEIGAGCELDKDEVEIVKVAAMLHDIGYLESCKDHEKNSADIAAHFLHSQGASDDFIEKVKGCIMATSMPQQPANLMEKVLCDADLIHLASADYPEKAALLRKEWESATGKSFTDEEWQQKNIKFFHAHTFYTEYAKKYFEEGKRRNFDSLLKNFEILLTTKPDQEKKKKGIEKKDKKSRQSELKKGRGVETLFRTTSRNHIDLSSIADTKANIMISVNTILLSILLTVLFQKFEVYPYLAIPTIIFALVSMLTIIFAILATRPNVTRGTFKKEDVNNKNTNLLFFGNFHNMSLADYEWGMKEIIKDDDLVYSNLIRDIYYLGKVLGKKYLLLRISYTIFMFGLVISISAFIFVFFYFYQHAPV